MLSLPTLTNTSITLTPKHTHFLTPPHFLSLYPSSESHLAMSFLLLTLLFLSTFHAHLARPLPHFKPNSYLDLQEGEKSRLLDSWISPISVRFQTTDQANKFDEKTRRDTTSSSNNESQEGIKIKEAENHRKLMKENASKDTETVVETQKTEVGEDMVVMDYAQPHRKPPIHNEKQKP